MLISQRIIIDTMTSKNIRHYPVQRVSKSRCDRKYTFCHGLIFNFVILIRGVSLDGVMDERRNKRLRYA